MPTHHYQAIRLRFVDLSAPRSPYPMETNIVAKFAEYLQQRLVLSMDSTLTMHLGRFGICLAPTGLWLYRMDYGRETDSKKSNLRHITLILSLKFGFKRVHLSGAVSFYFRSITSTLSLSIPICLRCCGLVFKSRAFRISRTVNPHSSAMSATI